MSAERRNAHTRLPSGNNLAAWPYSSTVAGLAAQLCKFRCCQEASPASPSTAWQPDPAMPYAVGQIISANPDGVWDPISAVTDAVGQPYSGASNCRWTTQSCNFKLLLSLNLQPQVLLVGPALEPQRWLGSLDSGCKAANHRNLRCLLDSPHATPAPAGQPSCNRSCCWAAQHCNLRFLLGTPHVNPSCCWGAHPCSSTCCWAPLMQIRLLL